MRQISGYMIAFGMTGDEIDTMCVRNPARLVGLDPDAVMREVSARRASAHQGASAA
jgi:hypothetical protein